MKQQHSFQATYIH